jgi:hypothetical protein
MLKALLNKSALLTATFSKKRVEKSSTAMPLPPFISASQKTNPVASTRNEQLDSLENDTSYSLTNTAVHTLNITYKTRIKGWEHVTVFSAASWEEPSQEATLEDEVWKPGITKEQIVISRPGTYPAEPYSNIPEDIQENLISCMGPSALQMADFNGPHFNLPDFNQAPHTEPKAFPFHSDKASKTESSETLFNPPTPDILPVFKDSLIPEAVFNPLTMVLKTEEAALEAVTEFTLPFQQMETDNTDDLELFPPDSTPACIINATLNTQKPTKKQAPHKRIVEAFAGEDPSAPSLEELLTFAYPNSSESSNTTSHEASDILESPNSLTNSKPEEQHSPFKEVLSIELKPLETNTAYSEALPEPSIAQPCELSDGFTGLTPEDGFCLAETPVSELFESFGIQPIAETIKTIHDELIEDVPAQSVCSTSTVETPTALEESSMPLLILPATSLPFAIEYEETDASDPADYNSDSLQQLADSVMNPVEVTKRDPEIPVPTLVTMRTFKEEQGLIPLKSTVTLPVLPPPPSEAYADLRTILINMGLERLLPGNSSG